MSDLAGGFDWWLAEPQFDALVGEWLSYPRVLLDYYLALALNLHILQPQERGKVSRILFVQSEKRQHASKCMDKIRARRTR